MKILLTILIGLLGFTVKAQLNNYIGTWITPENELIEIRDTTNKYGNSNHIGTKLRDEGMSIYLLDDTLSFQERYYSSATNFKKLYIKRYDLRVIKLTDSVLAVEPVSDLSQIFFKQKKELTFTRQEYAVDNDIKFEKLMFHTSDCFGTCPTFHLEIDSLKNAKLFIEEIFKKNLEFNIDSSQIGYYKGKLNKEDYEELIHLLKTCNLKSLEFNEATCCDGSIISIIVYFNGQRKYLMSMFPPVISNRLINHLYKICKTNSFKKTTEQFEIEKSQLLIK